MIYVATAYWCDEHWVIAAGHEKEVVIRAAEVYMEKRPDASGRFAESYIVEEVEESK